MAAMRIQMGMMTFGRRRMMIWASVSSMMRVMGWGMRA